MTDPGPFAPPPGALPPRSVEAPPAASVLPPPTGRPVDTAPPAFPPPLLPPPPRRRRWLVPVIVGGSLALVALIGGVAAVAVQLGTIVAQAPLPDSDAGPVGAPPEQLLQGEPGSPVAVDPLTCDVCFAIDDARTLRLPDESYEAVGLTVGDNAPYEVLAGDDQSEQSGWWLDEGGTPDACYFTFPKSPLAFAPVEMEYSTSSTDFVFSPEWHSDEERYYVGTESVRVFDDTATAGSYMAALETAVAGCPNYSLPESGWSSVVTAAPALDLPASVAAYGWVETGGYARYYAVDLQRGNLVARLTLASDGDGPTETEFRDLVEEYALLLAALEAEF